MKLWSSWTLVPFGMGVLKFLSPLKSNEVARESMRVAGVNDIVENTAKIVRFNKDPIIIVHTAHGQFKAFSARCTHLGCVVQFKADEGAPRFDCNCHGSQFDIDGKNIAGPAPRPLTPLKISIQESNLFVTRI
jgi:Rieske Fe-S protein